MRLFGRKNRPDERDPQNSDEARDRRVDRQVEEGQNAVREAMRSVGLAMASVERVATELEQRGDAPMADLE